MISFTGLIEKKWVVIGTSSSGLAISVVSRHTFLLGAMYAKIKAENLQKKQINRKTYEVMTWAEWLSRQKRVSLNFYKWTL